MRKFVGPLVPFRLDLVMSLADASERSGRAINTVRTWCAQHHLGRKVGGTWHIDAIAFELYVDGRFDALERYLNGDRAHPEIVDAFTSLGVPLTPPSIHNPASRRRSAYHERA